LPDTLTAASWALAPHTAAKLDILGAYLRAWFPILSRGHNFDRIIYIDGFAGPGRYQHGEDGSPIVALKAALGALNGQVQLPFEFHFVERRRRMVAALNANIAHLREHCIIPSSVKIYVHGGLLFEDAYQQHIRPRLLAHPRAPAFALADPFGWTGLPMQILTDLMTRPSTEVLVNFMFEEINRFLNHPDQHDNFDELSTRLACRSGPYSPPMNPRTSPRRPLARTALTTLRIHPSLPRKFYGTPTNRRYPCIRGNEGIHEVQIPYGTPIISTL